MPERDHLAIDRVHLVQRSANPVLDLLSQGFLARGKALRDKLLGEFVLTGLRRAPKGEVEIEVAFHISADGIVSVKAKDLETGLEQSITVTATSGLTEDEIRDMIDENEEYMLELRSGQEFEKHRQQAEKLLDDIEALFERVTEIISGSDFGRDAVKKARSVCEKARQAINSRDLRAVMDSAEALARTLNMFNGVVSKTGAGQTS